MTRPTSPATKPRTAAKPAPASKKTKVDDPAPDLDAMEDATPPVVDLDRYVPAFLTWIANKLSRGASQHYLKLFDVGIETWRCMVLLAIEDCSAQQISKVIGMDKASVSRCFRAMQERELVTFGLDAKDGRLRIATLTTKGRELHDQIYGIAIERERAFLSVLSTGEHATLVKLLKRLHENLPEVDRATEAYVSEHFPEHAGRRALKAGHES